MPNVRAVMQIINDALTNDQFKSAAFQQARFSTLAYIEPTTEDIDSVKKTMMGKSMGVITSQTTYRPCLVDNNGECEDLSLDDRYNLQVFHLLDESDFSEKLADDFGPAGFVTSENNSCRMIMFGDTSRLNLAREDIMSAALMDFPRELDAGQLVPLGLSACVFDQVTVSQDSESLFAELWKGHEYLYTPSIFMFGISYRMNMEYNRLCFKLCP